MTSSTSCSTINTDTPWSPAMRRRVLSNSTVSVESSPDEGSSSRRTVGDVARARPSSTSRETPSGRPTASRLAIGARPSESIRSSTTAFSSGSGRSEASEGEEVGPDPALGRPGPVGEDQVLAHGQAPEDLGVLERAGQPAFRPQLWRRVGDIVPVQPDFTVRGADQAGEDAEQGALAGPVRPHQTDQLPGRDLDGGRVDGQQPPVADGDPGARETWRWRPVRRLPAS